MKSKPVSYLSLSPVPVIASPASSVRTHTSSVDGGGHSEASQLMERVTGGHLTSTSPSPHHGPHEAAHQGQWVDLVTRGHLTSVTLLPGVHITGGAAAVSSTSSASISTSTTSSAATTISRIWHLSMNLQPIAIGDCSYV